MTVISERLKTLRKTANMTQKAVAEAVGVTEVSYQRFEYGTVRPSLDSLIALASLFSCSIDYLVGHSDDPTRR